MGNDGGSIARRDDLVKLKKAPVKQDPKDTERQIWAFCALSKDPLQQPIVSCPLGKLYNKEAILTHLLSPPSSSTSSEAALLTSHIRSMKDLTTLSLTPNPALASTTTSSPPDQQRDNTESHPSALFVCPLSLREMNGSVRFVYRKPGGTVLSEASLREMRKGKAGDEEERRVDPVTGVRDQEGAMEEEWVTLNPKGEELEAVRLAWDARKAREKEEKLAAKKKRKLLEAADSTSDSLPNGPADKPKKVKKDKKPSPPTTTAPTPSLKPIDAHAPSVHAGSSIPKLSSTLAAKLAEQKKTQSAAIQSLYRPKDMDDSKDKDGRSNWMTRGAFTRYA